MRSTRRIIAPAIAIMLVFSGALALTFADTDGIKLSGITVKDAHPNGCVDCHAKTDSGDYRLNVELKAYKTHPDITAIVRTVPEDCAMCHRAGVAAGAMDLQTHRIHYRNPGENSFVKYYGGECLACHGLDANTGVMKVKSGAKNW